MIMGRGWGKYSSNITRVTIMTNILKEPLVPITVLKAGALVVGKMGP